MISDCHWEWYKSSKEHLTLQSMYSLFCKLYMLNYLQRIQDEIDSRARKFDFLDEAALFLIQKGDSTDAITTQAEIDSFRQYHRQVLDRVAITNARLSAMQVW